MPSFDESMLLGLSRDYAGTDAPPLGPYVPIGPNVPDDKVRRIWRGTIAELLGVGGVYQMYAGDLVAPLRRLLFSVVVGANVVTTLPVAGAQIKNPFLTIAPQTQFVPTQENQFNIILIGGGGGTASINVSQYDLRG